MVSTYFVKPYRSTSNVFCLAWFASAKPELTKILACNVEMKIVDDTMMPW